MRSAANTCANKFALAATITGLLLCLAVSGVAAQDSLSGATNIVPADAGTGVLPTKIVFTRCIPEERRVSVQINNGFLGFKPLNFKLSIDCGPGTRNTIGLVDQPPGYSDLIDLGPLVGGVRNKRCPLTLYGVDPNTLEDRIFHQDVMPNCGPVDEDGDDDDDDCEFDDDEDNDCAAFGFTCEVQKQELLTSFMAWGPVYLVLAIGIAVRVLFEFFHRGTLKASRRVEALSASSPAQNASDSAAFKSWARRRTAALAKMRALEGIPANVGVTSTMF